MVSKDHKDVGWLLVNTLSVEYLCCCGDSGVKGPRCVHNNKIKIIITMVTQCDSVRVTNGDESTHMYHLNLQLLSVLWSFTV